MLHDVTPSTQVDTARVNQERNNQTGDVIAESRDGTTGGTLAVDVQETTSTGEQTEAQARLVERVGLSVHDEHTW